MSNAVLETRNLTYSFQDGRHRRTILENVNASFKKGKLYAIVGSSGSGKTTFLSLIGALDSPESGEVLYVGKNIKEIGYEYYRRNIIGIVFQNYNLVQYMTAAENVMVAMGITDKKIEGNHQEYALKMLEEVGIDRKTASRTVNKLSGGEQQRVAIARALSTDVDIIMADEPTGNLDYDTSMNIVDIFLRLAHEMNKCVIIVTHDLSVAQKADVRLQLNPRTKSFETRKDSEKEKKPEEKKLSDVFYLVD